jgi:uncharacterized protein YkwD
MVAVTAGAEFMRRAGLLALTLVPILLGGCSLGSVSVGSGFSEPIQPLTTTGSAQRSDVGRADRVASLSRDGVGDRAPAGSFERAPTGSLSDRDYSSVRLDVDRAREQVNAYRKSKGLGPLTLNAQLTSAAKEHSRDLAKWDRISHYGSDGSNPLDRVKRTGYAARLAAENVGTGQATFEEVLEGWKKSPGHNKNLLLADARHMGLALVHDPKTEFKTFWTLVLGSTR